MLIPVLFGDHAPSRVRRQAVCGPVLLASSVQPTVTAEFKATVQAGTTWLTVGAETDAQSAIDLLHAGLHVVLLDCSGQDAGAALQTVKQMAEEVPRHRLGVVLSTPPAAPEGTEDAAWEGLCSSLQQVADLTCVVLLGMSVAAAEGLGKAWGRKLVKAAGGDATTLAICPSTAALRQDDAAPVAGATSTAVGALHPLGLHVACPCVDLARSSAPDAAAAAGQAAAGDSQEEVGSTLNVAHCLALCARSDRPDSLVATVVTDEYEHALGLVYSSKQSIVEAVQAGRGIYYSRSRGSLWRKGDTSGMWQELVSARLDCDSDALLFRVVQHGEPPAFCHKFTRSCWGDSGGISGLERTLWTRKAHAPPGSYTKRLFDDHALLRHKLLEESQELHEALEEGDADHVAAEAADLLYFALVATAAAGVKLVDVEGHLDRRALHIKRRRGDAKAARIAAAESELAAGAAGATEKKE